MVFVTSTMSLQCLVFPEFWGTRLVPLLPQRRRLRRFITILIIQRIIIITIIIFMQRQRQLVLHFVLFLILRLLIIRRHLQLRIIIITIKVSFIYVLKLNRWSRYYNLLNVQELQYCVRKLAWFFVSSLKFFKPFESVRYFQRLRFDSEFSFRSKISNLQ